MADEKKLLPVVGLDQAGIIKDVPGHILPPNAFTDGKNIFFKNNSVQKRKGTIKAVDDVAAIVATVSSTAGNTMTFDVDPALTVDSEFTIANATPSAFNGTYNVTAVDDTGKTVTVSQTLGTYTSGGTYTFTPKIDFVDYWPAPNNPQYIEVQQNSAASPPAPVFNSIRASGTRERIALISYEVEGITANSATPTITLDGLFFNADQTDVNRKELKVGEKLKVFGASPAGYDLTYTVVSSSYNSGTGKTEISCTSSTTPATAYTTDSAELRRDTFSPTSYLGITSQDWQSTFFAGGYAYILNDGYHTPHYLLASLGAQYETPKLTPLAGWDYQQYAGVDTHVSCKVIRGYKDVLIAGNFNEYPITAGVPSVNATNSFPGTIRISESAAAGEIPSLWEPGVGDDFANEFELSTTSAVQDIVPLQGVAMIYTTDSIHSLQFDSRGNPSVQTVAEGYGTLETGCVLEFDGKHIVIGSDDIYMFGGHPGSIQSICDGKVRDYFYDILSPTPAYLDNIFMVRDSSLDEIHIYYPTKFSTQGFCDEYLAWNYRNNTWTINECNNLVSGFLGPVRGGGVAGGTVTFSGEGNTTTSAQTEQQSITVDLDEDYNITGGLEIQKLDYSSSSTAVASTYEEEKISITIPSGIIPFSEEAVEFDFNSAFDSGASSRDLGTQTGSTTGTGTYSLGNSGINLVVSTEIPSNTTVSRTANNWSVADSANEKYYIIANLTTKTYQTIAGTVNGITLQTSVSNIYQTAVNNLNLASFDNTGYYLYREHIDFFNGAENFYLVEVTQTGIIGDGSGETFLTSTNSPQSGAVYTVLGSFAGENVGVPESQQTACLLGDRNAFSITTDTNSSSTKFELTSIPTGSNIALTINSTTLTQSNTSATFPSSSQNWSLTGTVPTQTHASTTNADGTLAAGSGTTSPTNISGFTGFNLTEQEFSATAKTDSGSGSYSRTITQAGGDGTTARTVIVDETVIPPASTTVNNGDTFNVSYTVSGGVLPTVQTATAYVVRSGRTFILSQGTNISSNTLSGTFFATFDGVQYGPLQYSSFSSVSSTTPTWQSGSKTINLSGSTTYSISSQSAGTDWTDNAATINTSTGVVTFPAQYKTTYTLTNGSSVTIDDVDFIVGSKSANDPSFAPSDPPLTISFSDRGSARAWTVAPGSAAQFALAGDGAFPDLTTRSFPANVGTAAAVTYAAGIINGSSPNVRAQAKSSDNTVLQVFYPNSDFSGTNTNITLTLTENDGSNVTADGSTVSTGTRTAQGQFFTQYRVQIENNNSDEIINITPTFNSTNIDLTGAQNTFAAEVGEYLRDEIISAVNASSFMTNEPDWYDDSSSGAAGSDYVIRLGSSDIENYSVTLTNINTTNVSYPGATSGINNTFTFFDVLTADSTTTPDTVVVKNPYNTTMTTLTTRSGETIESVMNRITAAIQADTNDGWGASHDTANDIITFTATAAGRYPSGTGAPTDSVYTDYSVIAFDYTQGSSVISAGNIPDINAFIDTQGAKESVKLTMIDPSRDNSSLDGPYEDTFLVGGSTNVDIANSIKNRIDNFWVNWTAVVTDTGVAATSPATGNKFKVTLTSVASDWILKDRTSSDITANDVVYPTDRAVYVKAVIYDSDVQGTSASATAGTNFDADTGASGNFIPADIQIGHPDVLATTLTIAVNYAATTVTQSVQVTSAANADNMATSLANVIDSSAVPALSASASGPVMTISTNDLTQQINSINITFDEQSTQGGRNSVSRTNGNNISTANAAPSTTESLNTVTDADRPYATTEFNLNKFYPIVANQTSIFAEDFGYTFNADPPNNVTGSTYTSYVERIQLPIDNSVEYKKNISYAQFLVDNNNIKVKVAGMDSPGQNTNLYNDNSNPPVAITTKEFDFNEDYKVDFRINGRVLNYYITDGSDYNTSDANFQLYKGWRVSGVGFKVEGAESRGRNK